MRFAYPVEYAPQEGGYLVTFPDVPEAITDGRTRKEAAERAVDGLVTALSFYVDAGEPLPAPGKGEAYVVVPALQAAKLALYQAMKTSKVSSAELARRLGATDTVARRLVDLRHRSHIDQVIRALNLLGKQAVLEVA